jgi:hypothetical protein
VRADGSFQGVVDLSEEPGDPVRSSGSLFGQIIVEAAEHGQFRGLFVSDRNRA